MSISITYQAICRLNQAMASNKVRGDLGEEALEQILTDSGLIEGKLLFTKT